MNELPINQILCGDAVVLMKEIPNKSIDLVLTDPPFFVLNQLDSKGTWDNFNNLDEFLEFSKTWLKECYRVLKTDSQAYVFWSQTWQKEFWNLNQPFKIKRMLIWNNPCKTRGFTSRMYLWNYCPIFYLTKGKISRFNASFLKSENVDVFRFPAPQTNFKEDKQYHFLQKPLKLVEILVRNSTDEGDLVLDPFVGSGTTCIAAKKQNRCYIGFDNDPRYVEIARNRLISIPQSLEAFG